MLEEEIGGRRVALLFGGTHQREPGGVLGVRLVVGVAAAGQAGNVGRLEWCPMTLLQSSRRASSPASRLSSEAMVTQLSDVLAPASLTHAERRVVERLVELLRDELGSDLHAIWLYGSRARGETPHPESDVDLMVIADGGSGRYGMKSIELVNEVAEAEGVSPVWYSVFIGDPERIRGRREIRSFFIAEVDRDKIVLYGSGLE